MLPLSTWRHWKLSKMHRRWLRHRGAAALAEAMAAAMAAVAAIGAVAVLQARQVMPPMAVTAAMAVTAMAARGIAVSSWPSVRMIRLLSSVMAS